MTDLVGGWSADGRYGPGAQSDDVLWFLADGHGRLDSINFSLNTVNFFTWEMIRDGIVRITATKTLQRTNEGIVEQDPPRRLSGEHPFQIAFEECPNRQTLEVLRINLGWPPEGAFARAHKPHDDFESPNFGL